MNEHEAYVLSVSRMMLDATAIGDALLRRDFDEARFRTNCITLEANALGLGRLSAAVELLSSQLGSAGGKFNNGYGAGLLKVVEELEAIGLGP